MEEKAIRTTSQVYPQTSGPSYKWPKSSLQGIKTMHLIRKGQVRRVPKDDVGAQVRFIHQLFGLVVERNYVQKS